MNDDVSMFTAADMTTAAAQGFRDGEKSVGTDNKALADRIEQIIEQAARENGIGRDEGMDGDAWDRLLVRTALTATPSAQAGEVDWRWQYVFQTQMRFMDAGCDKAKAAQAAEQDAVGLERAARELGGAAPQPQGDASPQARPVATVCQDNTIAIMATGVELDPGTKLFARPMPAPTVDGGAERVWMFKSGDNWHTFHNEKHRRDTIESGDWDVREFVSASTDVSGIVVAGSDSRHDGKFMHYVVADEVIPTGTRLHPATAPDVVLAKRVSDFADRLASDRTYSGDVVEDLRAIIDHFTFTAAQPKEEGCHE